MNIDLIPESAPFSTEQRSWLNGFLAGWLGLQDASPSILEAAQALAASSPGAAAGDDAPWHDPALPIDERLKLADGRPIERKLMAAMAQLDCGACGYLCETYSEAIARGEETRLTLCSPGGSETTKMLKRLLKDQPPATNGVHSSSNENISSDVLLSIPIWSRENPCPVQVLRSINLNHPGSEKQTHHVEIDLSDSELSYQVGDSLGIYPENCPELVSEVLATLGLLGGEPVTIATGARISIREALTRHCDLTEIPEALISLLSDTAGDPYEGVRLATLVDDDAPIAGYDVLDLLRHFASARPSSRALVRALSPIRARLYSIASSPKRHPGQVHLTVRKVTYQSNNRTRKGVASTMLSDRVGSGTPIRVFVQESHGFTIPADPDTPMIMIGPGTGIAPFRAFLQEREELGARGKNWLFFGDQRKSFDFLYEDELIGFLERGTLSRLDTAFSRDLEHKVYVQDRLLQNGAELFRWLQAGAQLFVCGDAKRMAADVDRALLEVVRAHGAMNLESATAYVADLASCGRYRRDVY
jgi:sulfite reductase (NADPH) flavoprotein alpha-component